MAAALEDVEEKNPVDETVSEVSVTDTNKIKLEDLKVVDLKNELEKRNLDKNGVKSVLVERLKSAIEKEGENPAEFNFEISPDNNKSHLKKKTESVETNGNIDMCDKLSVHEEKLDVTLQLSIDEEEAQLNEEESLIDIPKQSDIESKIEDTVELHNDLSVNEKRVVSDQIPSKLSATTKTVKSVSEDTKKKLPKATLQSKNEVLSSSAPKAVKVIGKNEKLKVQNIMARCLWVAGIPDTTRAADLKALFSKQGRVIAVKIVKNAKQTPSRCYGFITMATSKDAAKAIQNLHRTELHGQKISVEKAQSEPGTLLKKSESKVLVSAKKQSMKKEILMTKKTVVAEKEPKVESTETVKEENKTVNSSKPAEEITKKKDEKGNLNDKLKEKERKLKERREKEREVHRPIRRPVSFKSRSFGYDRSSHYAGYKPALSRRPFTSRIGFASSFRPRPSLLALQKMREDRFQRERFRERREAERRRADEISRHRYIERKQREEAYRLEREKEKLRIERELLEKERAEILKLEREKHRLERERLEREREELRRQAELRRSTKRPFSRVDRESDSLWDERKKSVPRYEGRTSFHSDPPSSSRFEYPPRDRLSYNRDYERHPDRFSTPKHLETLHRTDFGDRDARREVTIRTRDERQVFSRNDFRGRDRRSFTSRERERHSSSRREAPRVEWKHDRRVHERIISPSSTSAQRRMTYY